MLTVLIFYIFFIYSFSFDLNDTCLRDPIGFVVHKSRGVPTLNKSMQEPLVPARIRQAKEKTNNDSKADERGRFFVCVPSKIGFSHPPSPSKETFSSILSAPPSSCASRAIINVYIFPLLFCLFYLFCFPIGYYYILLTTPTHTYSNVHAKCRRQYGGRSTQQLGGTETSKFCG
jgi:hypothetical protein